MRHHKHTLPVFGRVKNQRVALIRSLARSLILEEGITTTITKAKALRPFTERLITAAKSNTVQSRRLVAARLGNAQDATDKLHTVIAPRYAKRAGGYTRIIHLGRVGKRVAEFARIEFVQ